MKTLKFTADLVDKILNGEKTSTFRLFDDKDLKEGDELSLINKETGVQFGTAKITSVKIKTLDSLTEEDWIGHHRFSSEEEMYKVFRTYYGDMVKEDTEVKIISFEFKKYNDSK